MTTPSITALLDGALNARLRAVNTATVARVESFDRVRQCVDVQPLIREGYLNEEGARKAELPAVVPAVPVLYLGGGGASTYFPLKRGDTVLLLFAHSSLNKWKVRGGATDPLDDRRHTLSDAIAIPGLRSFADALEDEATSSDDDMVIAAQAEGQSIHVGGSSGTQPTLMADDFLDSLLGILRTMKTAIAAAGNTQTGGTGIGEALEGQIDNFETAAAATRTTIAKVK